MDKRDSSIIRAFEVLSSPKNSKYPGYKGLYRATPLPSEDATQEYLSLWYCYAQAAMSPHRGVTTECTLEELQWLAAHSEEEGGIFEVVFFSSVDNCPYPSVRYGIDVTGFGGYSLLGDGWVQERTILTYQERINRYGLFDSWRDANSFLSVLKELQKRSPNMVEDEDWRAVAVFGLTNI